PVGVAKVLPGLIPRLPLDLLNKASEKWPDDTDYLTARRAGELFGAPPPDRALRAAELVEELPENPNGAAKAAAVRLLAHHLPPVERDEAIRLLTDSDRSKPRSYFAAKALAALAAACDTADEGLVAAALGALMEQGDYKEMFRTFPVLAPRLSPALAER